MISHFKLNLHFVNIFTILSLRTLEDNLHYKISPFSMVLLRHTFGWIGILTEHGRTSSTKWLAMVPSSFCILQSFSIGSNMWLSIWSSDPAMMNATSPDYAPTRDMYLGVYGAIGFGHGKRSSFERTLWIAGGQIWFRVSVCPTLRPITHTARTFKIEVCSEGSRWTLWTFEWEVSNCLCRSCSDAGDWTSHVVDSPFQRPLLGGDPSLDWQSHLFL